MDLSTISQFAQIVGNLAVVLALCFGMAQIRQFRRQRLDAAAIELMRSIEDDQFTHAFRLVYSMKVGTPADDMRALGPITKMRRWRWARASRAWACSCIATVFRCTWSKSSSEAPSC